MTHYSTSVYLLTADSQRLRWQHRRSVMSDVAAGRSSIAALRHKSCHRTPGAGEDGLWLWMGLLGTPVRMQVDALTLPLWLKPKATCAGAPHCHMGKLGFSTSVRCTSEGIQTLGLFCDKCHTGLPQSCRYFTAVALQYLACSCLASLCMTYISDLQVSTLLSVVLLKLRAVASTQHWSHLAACCR